MLGDNAHINTGLVVPHRKRPDRPLLARMETDNKEHHRIRARVEHPIGRLRRYTNPATAGRTATAATTQFTQSPTCTPRSDRVIDTAVCGP